MKPIKKLFWNHIPAICSLAMGCMLLTVLALLLFAQPAFSAYYTNLSQLSYIALLPVSALLIAFLFYLRHREGENLQSFSPWALRAVFLVVLGIQFLVARCCWYKMGWDISVVYTTAEELGLGLPLSNPSYFTLCPNNAPLTILQTLPLWVAGKIGLGVPFVVLPYIDAVLLNLSAYACVRCVQMLTKSRVAHLFAIFVAITWIALSPYILFPYTDTFAIPFPILALYAWLRIRRPAIKWFFVSGLCFFGASIKPTVLIFLIALILLSLCQFLAQRDFSVKVWKRGVIIAAALIIGALPGRLFQQASTVYLAGTAKPQEQLSVTHYLMLGMNGDTYGGHSVDDVNFSQSYATLDERQPANLRRAWERLTSRSLTENLHFFAVKAYKAYADGSFASHSSFIELEVPQRPGAFSAFLRDFYHKRGDLVPYCQTFGKAFGSACLPYAPMLVSITESPLPSR